jgi:hypothetical protein
MKVSQSKVMRVIKISIIFLLYILLQVNEELEYQIDEAIREGDDANPIMWRAILNPKHLFCQHPSPEYKPGSDLQKSVFPHL